MRPTYDNGERDAWIAALREDMGEIKQGISCLDKKVGEVRVDVAEIRVEQGNHRAQIEGLVLTVGTLTVEEAAEEASRKAYKHIGTAAIGLCGGVVAIFAKWMWSYVKAKFFNS